MRIRSLAVIVLCSAVGVRLSVGAGGADGTLTGFVRTSAGDPCAGAEVRIDPAAADGAPDGATVAAATAPTDADGRFAFASLPPGRYAARASHPTHGRAASRPFEIVAGSGVVLPQLTLRLGATLVVRVADAVHGRPIPGAFVECTLLAAERPEEPPAADARAFVQGGMDGVVRVPGLTAGRHEFAVLHPRFRASARESVDLRDGDLAERSVRLDLGATLAGTVTDDEGAPIANAMVEAIGEEPPPWTRTGADGGFVLSGLPDRDVAVLAQADGHRDARLPAVPPGSVDLQIVLERIGARVPGRVTANGALPDGPLLVTALRLEFDPEFDAGTPYGEPVPVRDGAFVFENLPPGAYRLLAESTAVPDWRGDAGPFVCEPGVPANEVTIALAPSRPLLVRVVDAATGTPLRGALVGTSEVPRHEPAGLAFAYDEISSIDDPWITDEHGRCRVRLDSTAKAILAAHADYAGAAAGVPADPAAEALVALERGGVIEGVARDAAGSPLANRLVVPMAQGAAFRVTRVGEDGRFRVAGLAAGPVEIGLAPAEPAEDADLAILACDVRTVDVESGRSVRADFDGSAAGGVRGTLVADGETRAGTRVELRPLPFRLFGAGVRRTRTLDDGSFSFTGVVPGAYSITARLELGRAHTEIRVAEGSRETRADLAPPAGGLRVRVLDRASGEPIPGAHVDVAAFTGGFSTFATLDSGGRAWGDTDSNGIVLLRLEPGRFVVSVAAAQGRRPYATAHAAATVGESGLTPVEFSLEPGFWVEGVVRDDEGEPVPNPFVVYFDTAAPQPSGIDECQGLPDGRFLMTGLRPGVYSVSVVADGFAPRSGVQVRVERGGVPGPVVRLGRGGAAVVRVVTRDDEPLRGAFVGLTGPAGTGFSTVDPRGIDTERLPDLLARSVSDELGFVRFDLLEPGEYAFEVDLGKANGRATAVVREGESVDVAIVVR